MAYNVSAYAMLPIFYLYLIKNRENRQFGRAFGVSQARAAYAVLCAVVKSKVALKRPYILAIFIRYRFLNSHYLARIVNLPLL
jgi:hypothetical protein